MKRLAWLVLLAACGSPHRGLGDDVGATPDDAGTIDSPHGADAMTGDDSGAGVDSGGTGVDAGGTGTDAMVMADAAPIGPISGGPCLSGHAGATAYRIRWAGNGAGSTAYPVYETNGLPDHSRDHAGAFPYQIGGMPRWDDPFLGVGGLVLDGSDFVDLELSTVGLSSISNATISIFGRSFNTTAPGGFFWQTFDGTGQTPSNFVSNSAPYQWYSADMTTEISAGDDGVLLRIKAVGGSGSLIVNRIELCVTAN
jgi:hypothetical protein